MKVTETDEQGMAVIRCLKCGEWLYTHDGRSTMHHELKCPYCNKLVVYYPTKKEVVMKDIPPRTSSSGIRFW